MITNNRNNRKATFKKKSTKRKSTKRKSTKRKTKKNNNEVSGGWKFFPYLLDKPQVLSEDENEKLGIIQNLDKLKISTLIENRADLTETDITETDIIEYALFALDLNERCINICNDALCKSCIEDDNKCEGVCTDFTKMRGKRNAYETTNFCGMDFMKNYTDTDTYYCKKYIDMASIIRQVRYKFETTNPTLYDYLNFFDNTYKGDYKLNDVKSYLISYKTQQDSIPLQNGSGNNYKKSKTRKSKKI
jgi:hypothetical protein